MDWYAGGSSILKPHSGLVDSDEAYYGAISSGRLLRNRIMEVIEIGFTPFLVNPNGSLI